MKFVRLAQYFERLEGTTKRLTMCDFLSELFQEADLKEIERVSMAHRPARVDSLIEPDVWVEPHYVFTVLAEEITRSPVHTCGKKGAEPGYALRFPRIAGWVRADKRPEDATTVHEIRTLHGMQRRVKA
jgi:DNA ligase 1